MNDEDLTALHHVFGGFIVLLVLAVIGMIF
jgi:hypothetical protein